MVKLALNLSTGGKGRHISEIKAGLIYITRPYLKKKKKLDYLVIEVAFSLGLKENHTHMVLSGMSIN